ncbi:MAG: MBL fold metallo-hydrolase [Planctomycetes bacterium]|nr:MBL fold metallo-hydrolase [Planctomycetota bacterium]
METRRLAAATLLLAAPLLVGAPHLAAPAAAPAIAPTAAPAAAPLAVAEVAPGVFFAHAATAPKFEGANSGFVVQDEQVVVIEASMPGVARALRQEIAQRTPLPVRVAFDTHDHWDHSFGNGVHADAGALIATSARCAELLASRGAEKFRALAESADAGEREQVAATRFAGADLEFERRLVVGRGPRRIEFLHLGRGHTRGDAVAWLPEAGVLFTGDLCVNGPFNYLGDADSAHWIVVLEQLMALRPKIVCPGHGAVGGPELLARQHRWLVELRAAVAAGIAAGRDAAAIAAALDLPWYREWTGVAASTRSENVAVVFDELAGRRPPLLLTEELGLTEGPSPSRADAGWSAPRKVVVVGEAAAGVLQLAQAVPGLEVVGAADAAAALPLIGDADGLLGACNAALLERGARLRWVQVGSAGVERYVGLPTIASRQVALTNAQRLYGPEIADHALGMVLALMRGLPAAVDNQRDARAWGRGDPVGGSAAREELRGKTVLIAGLGGIGREIAVRAAAFGARVVATSSTARPPTDAVERIEAASELLTLAATADLVFVCVPLTPATERLCDARFFAALKPGAWLCNVARGKCVDTSALLAALDSGRLAGAALDVTEPEPLPPDHPLWQRRNVLITPHVAADSAGAQERQFLLFRENLRRFAAGERLLSVVDPAAGW